MYTADQYRVKAAEYKKLLDNPCSPGEAREFRNLEQTYTTLADNEEWMARNRNKTVGSGGHDQQQEVTTP